MPVGWFGWRWCGRFALVALLGCVCQGAAAEYLIKFSHVVSPEAPKGRAASYFADQVNQRLAGRVRVEVYPNSTLYDDTEVMLALRLSGGDTGIMAAPSLSKFASFSQQLQVFDLPFLFASIDQVHQLQDSPLAAELLRPLLKKGLRGLAFWDNGMTVFSVRGDHPLRLPGADFSGMCLRIQNSNVHEAMVAALGGTPRKLPFKAVQMALARGGVDGQDNAWSNIRTQKFYRYQDYITVSEHSYLGYLVVASTGFWDRLPPDIRTELGVILDESAQQARQFAAAAEKADRAAIEADGLIHVVDLTAAELAAWKTATAVVEDRFRTQIGGELLDAIHLLFDRRE